MKPLDLGKEKISKLLLTFCIPCVISMLINSIYNIVDQIFIGKGVGTLGNAATNVIFPLVILFNGVAGLVGNGAAASMSLRLGENKKEAAAKSVGQAITATVIASIVLALLSYIFLPTIVMLFGCTENVYPYAIEYGRIIIIGAPFMIFFSALSNIIRADGAPQYSMMMLIVGAIINLILDPLFIFGFHMGVRGGALATIIGQIVSAIIAFSYIRRMKSVKLTGKDYKLDAQVMTPLSLGLSSFITQATVLVLFVYMNNVMTRFGAQSKFGADIPLSVYGVLSKINSLFISTVLGITIGAQPILGFNYGAGKKERVKETLKTIITVNLCVGVVFNILFFFFPRQIAGLFISPSDQSYETFMEFAVLMCRSFLLVIALNALEMTGSVAIQSLGKVKKATALAFIRQIILLIPISLFLAVGMKKGIYGVLYAGVISDSICFVVAIFLIGSEFVLLSRKEDVQEMPAEEETVNNYSGKHVVVTIAREYGSGGRFVGQRLAEKMGISFYDHKLLRLVAEDTQLSEEYVSRIDQNMQDAHYVMNNDDRLFLSEEKIIRECADKESCVIVGRCADYILDGRDDVVKVFLYSDEESRIRRAVTYYGLKEADAAKEISRINKLREKHYEHYTNRKWSRKSNYDICINVDKYGIEKTVQLIEQCIAAKA